MESKLFELDELTDLALADAADFFDEDLIDTDEEVNEADLWLSDTDNDSCTSSNISCNKCKDYT